MEKFALSVIIPNFNNGKYIRECIESICRQTYPAEEIIVVDDCSTDDSLETLRHMQQEDARIIVQQLQTNAGVSHARNVGIRMAKGEYVTFLDADDRCADSHKLENEMRLIKKYRKMGKDIAAYSKVVYIDEESKEIRPGESRIAYSGMIYEQLLCTFNTTIIPRDFCIRREIVTAAGAYKEDMSLYEDYELTLRIAAQYEFHDTGEAGTAYRLKNSGLSSRSRKECDDVFMSIFWKQLESKTLLLKMKYIVKKLLSYADRRHKPWIMRRLRTCKKILKKTALYRLKETLRQKRSVILFNLKLHNYFIKKKKTIGRKVISLEEYRKHENAAYQMIEPACERPVYLAPYFEQPAGEVRLMQTPEIYLAVVRNAAVIGGCGALFLKKYCILDILANDKENRVDYVTAPTCFYEKGKLYAAYGKKSPVIRRGITLCGVAPFNYYHFMIELMSRLEYAEQYIEDKTIPLLVDEAAFAYPQMEELFTRINRCNRPVVKVRNDVLYRVQELIYPSMNTWFPVNIQIGLFNRYEDFGIAKSALTNLRSVILKDSAAFGTRKIYISRKKKKLSRLVNETDVENLFAAYGFEVIYPEELTFIQQVQVFCGAKQVAGVSGAAFANIVFCAPDTKVICIIPKEYNFYLYSSMAYLLEEEFVFLNAELANKGENAALSQFRLDLSYCERFLMDLDR